MAADYPAAVVDDRDIVVTIAVSGTTAGSITIVLGVPFGGNVSAMFVLATLHAWWGGMLVVTGARCVFAKLDGLDSALMQQLIVSGARGRAAAYYVVLAQCSSCLPGAYTFLLRNVDPVDYSAAVAADEVVD